MFLLLQGLKNEKVEKTFFIAKNKERFKYMVTFQHSRVMNQRKNFYNFTNVISGCE